MRVSACEGVWEGCGGVCASVTVWVCVGVRLCTWAVCGCMSQSYPLICQRLWLSAYGLSVSPSPGVYIDNPPSTPASPPLLSSSRPSLRAYQSPELQLLLESHIQISFPIRPHLFPIHLLSFPLHPCFDLTSPSLLSPQPIVPLFLSCACLAKSQPCLNLFLCLSL